MSAVPFTIYDFFAYLSSGSVLVALADYVSGNQWLLKDKLPPGEWVLLIILAYVTGHAVAHVSSMVFEQGLVQRVLGKPSVILLGKQRKRRVFAFFFRGYCRSLPKETCDRIQSQAATRNFFGEGESLFLHAFATVCKTEASQKRLDEFRNVYGFARNMAFSLLVVALTLEGRSLIGRRPIDGGWGLVLGALGVIMLYRYLKFYRQYGYQLFVTYAELGELKPSSVTPVTS